MKKYDTWKIITTLITIIFIAVMVILNVINLSEEKNALGHELSKIPSANF